MHSKKHLNKLFFFTKLSELPAWEAVKRFDGFSAAKFNLKVILTALLLITLLFTIFAYIDLAENLRQLKSEIKQEKKEAVRLEVEAKNLDMEISRLKSMSVLVDKAKKELNMTLPTEIRHIKLK